EGEGYGKDRDQLPGLVSKPRPKEYLHNRISENKKEGCAEACSRKASIKRFSQFTICRGNISFVGMQLGLSAQRQDDCFADYRKALSHEVRDDAVRTQNRSSQKVCQQEPIDALTYGRDPKGQ